MQRPSGGYRGGIRMAHQASNNRPLADNDDDEEQLTISNSNSDEEDAPSRQHFEPKKATSLYSKMLVSSDFESAIRNLRPSATRQKKNKNNLNISRQKADLPQLNNTNENNPLNKSFHELKSNEKPQVDEPSRQWFPKPNVGHLDSDAFIRHNHVG